MWFMDILYHYYVDVGTYIVSKVKHVSSCSSSSIKHVSLGYLVNFHYVWMHINNK